MARLAQHRSGRWCLTRVAAHPCCQCACFVFDEAKGGYVSSSVRCVRTRTDYDKKIFGWFTPRGGGAVLGVARRFHAANSAGGPSGGHRVGKRSGMGKHRHFCRRLAQIRKKCGANMARIWSASFGPQRSVISHNDTSLLTSGASLQAARNPIAQSDRPWRVTAWLLHHPTQASWKKLRQSPPRLASADT